MIRFTSTSDALLDDKGRFVLPSSFKKTMGELAEEPLIIEKDINEPCLNIYPEKLWEEHLLMVESKLNKLDKADRFLLMQIYANYTTVTMAPNGRINIPSGYFDHAGIKREIFFVGQGDCISLWNEETYKEYLKKYSLQELYNERLGNPKKEAL